MTILNNKILIDNIDKIHTTKLGEIRISKNLNINDNVVDWCKRKVLDENTTIF